MRVPGRNGLPWKHSFCLRAAPPKSPQRIEQRPSGKSAQAKQGSGVRDQGSGVGEETRENARPAPVALVASADRDSDGSVSFGEFSTVVYKSIARRVDKRLRQLDRNHDGRCTRGEVSKMTAARFARFDLNRDGAFTAVELATVMQREVAERLARLYVRLDVNRDGRFSVAELTPAPKPEAPKVAALKATRRYVVARRGPTNVQ